tara:strand:+ start:2335 stop:2700 length:366 start_codon:yes stop_codon:yes gene_type:complete
MIKKNIHIIKSTKLEFGTVELRSDGVLEKMLVVFKNITNRIPNLYFCDNTQVENPELNSEGESFMTDHFHEFATHFAMTEDTAITRFVANTFIYLYKPKVQIKMFKKKQGTINWLKSINKQ